MRLDPRNTMMFRVFLYLLSSEAFGENVDFTQKQHILFDLAWKVQNVTNGSKIG